jgi:hypothetical protein
MKPISEKKQRLLDEFNASPYQVGELIYVLNKNDNTKYDLHTIESINGDEITVFRGKEIDRKPFNKSFVITSDEIVKRFIFEIGANPFENSTDSIRTVAYSLSSIVFNLDINGEKYNIKDYYKVGDSEVKELNWNPFVLDKDGNKIYYQRDFVWSINDKQLLIESIYQGIDCGKILIRKRGWAYNKMMEAKGEKELYFNDIVDGKQRLNAIGSFLKDEFQDLHGNYYSDLSASAQNRLLDNHLFSFAEMPESTTDDEVIKQFLKLNFCGVPQSKEHIDFVKSINLK